MFAKFFSELCSTNWVLLRIVLPSWTLVLHNFTNLSHYAKGTNSKSPSNGVGFYKHFPKNVIRPYQGTQELITDEMVKRRVKFYTCEMLKRPRIAMSELAQTTSDTIHCLGQLSKKTIMDSTPLKNVTEAVKPINDLLQPLQIMFIASKWNQCESCCKILPTAQWKIG